MHYLELRDDRANEDTTFPPPPGVTPNFVNPESRGRQLVITALVLCILTILVVGIRLVARFHMFRKFLKDDITIIFAVLIAIAYCVIVVVQVEAFDIGRHIWNVPGDLLYGPLGNTAKNLTFTANMVYLWGIWCAKMSLLFLYRNIFGVKRWVNAASYAMMAFISGYCLLFFFMLAFYCNPPAMAWNTIGWTGPGSCLSPTKIFVAIGAFNIVTDTALLFFPIPLVAKLQMDRRKRLGLLFVFATGAFTVIASIVREIIVVRTLVDADQTWVYIPTALWLCIELDVGIICTCLPCLAPLGRQDFLDKMLPSSLKSLITRSTTSIQRRQTGVEVHGGSNTSRDTELYHLPSGQSDTKSSLNAPENGIGKRTVVEVLSEQRRERHETV